MGNLTRPFNIDEKVAMQKYINNGYELFVKRCAEGRGMSVEAIQKIAEGRVWTGEKAKELGLVDELGGLDKAIDIAIKKAGTGVYSIVNYPSQGSIFETLLEKGKKGYIQSQIPENLRGYYNYVQFLENVKNMNRIQARMPFDLCIQ